MNRSILLLTFTLALAIQGCKKSSDSPKTITGSGSADVYIAGYETDAQATTSIAEYWKNGKAVPLTDGKSFCVVNGISVDGSDVYVSGFQDNMQGVSTAVYWKNGVQFKLSDGTTDTYAYAVVASGGNNFVAGYYIASGGTASSSPHAAYWMNGTRMELPLPGPGDTNLSAEAFAIAVSGGDIYAAGSEVGTNPDGSTLLAAVYWKNGVFTKLPQSSETAAAYAYGIAINGSDVYVAGVDNEEAVYWKNGTEISLTKGDNNGGASAITISGNDVYIAGGDTTGTVYWKNNVATTEKSSKPELLDNATGIAVKGSDVYVAGNADNTSLIGIAKYWKNGSDFTLSDGTKKAYATGIVVK